MTFRRFEFRITDDFQAFEFIQIVDDSQTFDLFQHVDDFCPHIIGLFQLFDDIQTFDSFRLLTIPRLSATSLLALFTNPYSTVLEGLSVLWLRNYALLVII